MSGSGDQTLRLSDLRTGAELRRFHGHTSSITTLALLPDGNRVLSGSWDHTLRLWDIQTGAELCRFQGHSNRISAIAVLADGRRAVSASADHTLRLWNLETGTNLACFIGDSAIDTIAISPIGDKFIAGDAHGRVMVFAIPP